MKQLQKVERKATKAFWSWKASENKLYLGESFSELFDIAEHDLEGLKEKLEIFSENGQHAEFTAKTSHQSGNEKSLQLKWQGEVVQCAKSGEPLLVTGSVQASAASQPKHLSLDDTALLFSRLMDNIRESIYFKDRESRFIMINRACAEKFGLNDPAEAVGKTDFDFFEDEHARPAFEDEKKIIETETPIINKEEKEVYPGKPDEIRWVSTSKMPLYDESGEIIGTLGISKDITRRKQAEEELKENNKLFSMLSERAPGFLYLYRQDPEGNVQFPYASEGIKEIFELEPSDLKESIGPLIKRVHEEDIDRVMHSIRESIDKVEEWECEYRIILPGNRVRWVKGKAQPEKQEDGSVISSGYITDITEEKKILETNVRLRKQFEAIFNTAPNLIFVKDLEGRYLMANKAACDFFRQNTDEIVGKTDRDFGISEKRVEAFKKADRQVAETGEPLFIPEDKTIDPEGNEVWHQTIKVPFHQIESDKPAVLAVVTDITKRKKKENELNESLDIIGEQNKRLMNFAHIVSHNLRNHAGNISMLLSLYDTEESEDEQEELLEHLRTASKRLNETIADLNEIIDQQHKNQVKLKEVNIQEYVSKIKEILTTEILAYNVKFNEDIPADLDINYNPAYLESIILNLLSNAIKYRHPDRTPKIDVKAYKEEERVWLEVSDNGLGMDLEKCGEKLFGMYNTFHSNENSKGIGLFITKNQIESMGGSIEVDSEPGNGTTFKILLK